MEEIHYIWTRLIFLFAAIGISSCEEPVEEIYPNQYVQISEATGSFNRYDPDNSSYTFTISTNPPSNLQIEYIQVNKRLNDETSVEMSRINQFPTEITLSLSEIAAGTDLSLITRNDRFSLHFYIKAAGNPSIYRINQSITMPVLCPVNIGGRYLAMTKGRAGPGGGGDFENVATELTITDLGDFKYEISDISGGMFTAVWGGDPQPAVFHELCRDIQIPEFQDQWGDTFNGNGKLEDDGKITLFWRTSYGDIGTTELTPL